MMRKNNGAFRLKSGGNKKIKVETYECELLELLVFRRRHILGGIFFFLFETGLRVARV